MARDPIAEFDTALKANDKDKLRQLYHEALNKLAQTTLSFDEDCEHQRKLADLGKQLSIDAGNARDDTELMDVIKEYELKVKS